jgi:amylosucrase/maltose alpha-D-glucosyltransferase/alpha-amylase
MALLWEALATRNVNLLRHAMERRFSIPGGCAWVNYIRCHDDIGWAFSNEDAVDLSINPHDHRHFLTQFFTDRYPDTFARGLPFQEDPQTGDARVSGTTASLCGLEKALEEENEEKQEMAVRRILLIHGVIMTIGGVPMLYLGDEIGMLNDYDYENDNEKVGDSRWVHRPVFDWEKTHLRHDMNTLPGKIFQGLLRLQQIRRQNLAFTRTETEIIDTGNEHVFGYFRQHSEQNVLILANFSDEEQIIEARHLRLLGLGKTLTDIVAGRTTIATRELEMEPYQFMILLGRR